MDPQWLIEQFNERCYELQFIEAGLDDLKHQFFAQQRLGQEYVEQTSQQCAFMHDRLNQLLKDHQARIESLKRVRDRLVTNQQESKAHYLMCNEQVNLAHDLIGKWSEQQKKAEAWQQQATRQKEKASYAKEEASRNLKNTEHELSVAKSRLSNKLAQKVPVTHRRNDGSHYVVYETPDASYERSQVTTAKNNMNNAEACLSNALAALNSARDNYYQATHQLTAASNSLDSARYGKTIASDAVSQATDSLKDAQVSVEGIEEVLKETLETIAELLEKFKSNIDEQQFVLKQTQDQHFQVDTRLTVLEEARTHHLKSADLLQQILSVKSEQLDIFDYTE